MWYPKGSLFYATEALWFFTAQIGWARLSFLFAVWGWGLERENVQSSSDSRVINVSSSSLMYSLTSYSKNLRGTAPHCSTTSWKSLISNLSPANKILINFKNNEVAEFFVSINPSLFLLLLNVLASYKLYPLLGRFFNLRGNLVNFEEKNENKILVLFIKFSYMYLVHF